jgi:hypothetical protein
MGSVTGLDLEFRLHRIGDAAASERLGVDFALGIEMVVRALEILKPRFVWAVGRFPTGVTERCTNQPWRSDYGRASSYACRHDDPLLVMAPFADFMLQARRHSTGEATQECTQRIDSS